MSEDDGKEALEAYNQYLIASMLTAYTHLRVLATACVLVGMADTLKSVSSSGTAGEK